MQRKGNHVDIVPHADYDDEPCRPNEATWIAVREVVNLRKLLMLSHGNAEKLCKIQTFLGFYQSGHYRVRNAKRKARPRSEMEKDKSVVFLLF